MDNRRAQRIYVAVAWLFAVAAIGSFVAADGTSGGVEGRAPTAEDYRRSCYSILLFIASLGFSLAGAFWSFVGVFLLRSPWVIACAVAAAVNVSPWLLMVAMDTVLKVVAYPR